MRVTPQGSGHTPLRVPGSTPRGLSAHADGLFVDEARRLIEVRYTGEVALADRVAVMRQVLAILPGSDIRNVLLDFRQAHSLPGEEQASRDFVDRYAPTLVRHGVRLAFVVQHDHQLNAAVEQLMAERGVESRRFSDNDDAIAWLGAAGRASPGPSEPGSDWSTWID